MGKRLQLTSSFISLCLALKVCSMLFFETGSLTNLGLTILATLAVQQSPVSTPSPSQSGITGSWCCACLLTGCWGPRPGLPGFHSKSFIHWTISQAPKLRFKNTSLMLQFPWDPCAALRFSCHTLLASSLSLLEAHYPVMRSSLAFPSSFRKHSSSHCELSLINKVEKVAVSKVVC